jgi:hypothetical protein
VEWPLIKKLAELSAGASPETQVLDGAQWVEYPSSHGFVFNSERAGFKGGISYLKFSQPIAVYGYLEGKNLNTFSSVELVSLGDAEKNQPEQKLASFPWSSSLQSSPLPGKLFFKLTAPGSLKDLPAVRLRFYPRASEFKVPPVEVLLPFKREFENSLDRSGDYP